MFNDYNQNLGILYMQFKKTHLNILTIYILILNGFGKNIYYVFIDLFKQTDRSSWSTQQDNICNKTGHMQNE